MNILTRHTMRYLIAGILTIVLFAFCFDVLIELNGSHIEFTIVILALLVYCSILRLLKLIPPPRINHRLNNEAFLVEKKAHILQNLEFLRIVFTLEILCHHFIGNLGLWQVSWQAVNFFFILSGFLMAKTFSPEKKMLDYVYNSVTRFMPLITLGVCLRLLCSKVINIEGALSEIFFLSTTGIYEDRPYNKVSWYISILFWVGLLFLFLLKTRRRESVNLCLGIMAFFGVIALNKRGFQLGFLGDDGTIGNLIEMTLVYGLALTAAGFLTWEIFSALKSRVTPHHSRARQIIFTLLELILLTYSVAMMHFPQLSTLNFAFSILVFSSLISMFVLKEGWFSRLLGKIEWSRISQYCLATYLTQGVIMWSIFPRVFNLHQELMMEHKVLTIMVTLTLCALVGVWARHVVEEPCGKLLRKLFG